ncbi:MAG: type II toxin-antitoxin system PemK/MazF family toxin [Clostridia bacterium]|nr:type II toxin-antitoxin system PemK/MazF family toxin [Clostridia bacterium]
MSVKRGDIYYADLSPVVGSEQGGLRPVLIIQNDVGNRYSPTVIAAAITSRLGKNRLPTHIDVYADRVGLVKDSVILLEQVRTLDKRRLKEKMGHLDEGMMDQVNRAIAVSVGLGDWQPTEQPRYAAAAVQTVQGAQTTHTAPAAVASAQDLPIETVGQATASTAVSAEMAAQLNTQNAASPEFGEVIDGDVVR